MQAGTTRRNVLLGATGLALAHATNGAAQGLALPAAPVALNVIDVAGNLQLTQAGIERFRQQNPNLVSRITFSRAPSPELPAKLKAQQDANRVDIDLVLTGPGALSDGITQGLWIDVWTKHPGALPKPEEVYHEQALMMQKNFGKDQGVAVVYSPSGPLFEYAPERVKNRPRTIADLLAWVKANPNRFTYARPVNSGPGWTFLMGLPYLLGDRDPKDPVNGWDKTWAYLKEMDAGIDYYPSGTTPTMKELAEGTRDMIVTTCGWDINPRALGVVPKEVEVFALEGTHWVPDTQFMCIPKGVPDDKVAVLLNLMAFMLKPEQQALTYDKGYFYPGPATRGVTLAMAPAESQSVIKEFGRP
ncbi:MAG TPA: extracellular solute-binding protein, partial [Microvirga sp.]|nr:extracellular solute-binding protein [Microvirga sp.]